MQSNQQENTMVVISYDPTLGKEAFHCGGKHAQRKTTLLMSLTPSGNLARLKKSNFLWKTNEAVLWLPYIIIALMWCDSCRKSAPAAGGHRYKYEWKTNESFLFITSKYCFPNPLLGHYYIATTECKQTFSLSEVYRAKWQSNGFTWQCRGSCNPWFSILTMA